MKKSKKLLALLLCLAMVFGLAACGNSNKPADSQTPAPGTNTETPAPETETPGETEADPDAIEDSMTSADGKYQVAFLTDVGQLKDKSFNQGTYDGVKLYANANGKAYKYYQPANGSEATDDDRFAAMKAAVDNGAKVVVCAGYLQEAALRTAAKQFTDVSFVFIDGYPVGEEADVKDSPALSGRLRCCQGRLHQAGLQRWRRRQQPRLLPLRLWLRAGR